MVVVEVVVVVVGGGAMRQNGPLRRLNTVEHGKLLVFSLCLSFFFDF